ncbi:glucose dehydrogenase [FAD, quinone]-like [Leptopilina heterotoma]|uniref:glucose dehydrogenase [FAD, quinone]-like n=1 Tax=Leptopilina heterotoma TaxID=63436 RepID=UPI001CA88F8F|nr:glucose dehydrogenase [FAD, quinone]-like [Leptopilina heterotoma]
MKVLLFLTCIILPTLSVKGGCCHCNFNDTAYMEEACEHITPFMTLVQSLIMSRCDISEACKRVGSDQVPEDEWFDFIIVGAGVAGPILARRLSDHAPWRVLLVEAGPEEPSLTAVPGLAFNTINTSLDWKYMTEATQPYPTACLETDGKCAWPRGKMVSGTGGMNGMMYVRGHPEIYNKWARAGNPGWSYEEIEHYFERAENPVNTKLVQDEIFKKTQTGGPINIDLFSHKPDFSDELLKAARELGYETERLRAYNQTGFIVAPMMTAGGLRGTTSKFYLRPVADKPNLRLLTNAHVSKILLNKWDMRVNGIELIDKEGKKRIMKADKEIILTAGAIGSPQLLMLSGIGPKEDLQKLGITVYQDLPVGRILLNHVSVGIPMSIKDDHYETMTIEAVNQYIKDRTGPLSSTGLTQVTAFMESSYASPGISDLQVFFDGFSSGCPETGHKFECPDGRIGSCPNRREIVARPTVVITKSRGYLQLRSTNPLDHPLIYPNYFTNETDLKILIEGVRKVIKLISTKSMRKWGMRLEQEPNKLCSRYHFNTDAYWECIIRVKTGPENHQSGTCKMGSASDPESVVNSQLQVHGISNLRVADASVFPILPNANPIAPIVMVAEKAADLIRYTWLRSGKRRK